jgi:hypothetical protein
VEIRELEAQTTLIVKRIRDHKSSSPDSIIEMVLQVKKGSTLKVYSHALLEAWIANLEEANQAASECKKRKKKRIQKGGTLSQVEAEDRVAQKDVEAQFEVERREERVRTGASRGGIRHCKRCGETGHNKRTCKKGEVELGD